MSARTTMAAEYPPESPAHRSAQPESGFPIAPIVGFLLLWLGLPTLVLGLFVHPVFPGGWVGLLATFSLVVFPIRALARGFGGSHYPSAGTRIFLLRPFWYAMLFLPLIAAASLVGGLAGLPFGAAGTVGRWAAGMALLLASVAALIGYLGSRRLVTKALDIHLPRLPESFDGLRIVQISDLHVGPHTRDGFLRQIARTVEEAEPDSIFVTGDQVDDFARDAHIFGKAFGHLQAPLGTYVVAGNHDVYAGWDGVERGLVDAGFTVLVNQAVAIERQGQRIWIAGTGDPAAGSPRPKRGRDKAHPAAPDIARTLAGIPAREPVLALAHNPALWPALAEAGVDFTASGHTHYGQLAIPSLGWSLVTPFSELDMGSHRRGRSLLYIHPGTNYWGIPFRIGTPPEVAILTLRASPGEAPRVEES